MRKIILLFTALTAALVIIITGLTGCNNKSAAIQPETCSFFAMDTYMTLTAYGDNAEEALQKAEQEVRRLDMLLSATSEDGDIRRINAAGKGRLGEEASYIMKRSVEAYNLTGGTFNPMIYPVVEAWGFTDQNYRVPSETEIKALLPLVSMDNVLFNEQTGDIEFLKNEMKTDFGAIAKGYTSARLMDIFRESEVESACVSLGGNVQVLGTKPGGDLWKIAIRDPYDTSGYLGILSASDKAVITSGAYERYFEQDGTVYHHILDPFTGYPADSGIDSATIICSDGTLADALSTAVYVMGLDEAAKLWKDNSEMFDMIIMTSDHTLYITSGVSGSFKSDKYTPNLIRAE